MRNRGLICLGAVYLVFPWIGWSGEAPPETEKETTTRPADPKKINLQMTTPNCEIIYQKDGMIRLWLDPAMLTKREEVLFIRCEMMTSDVRDWKPLGNFDLMRDASGRILGGSFVYQAPREGVYRFRSVAVNRTHVQEIKLTTGPEAVVTVDVTPPRVSLYSQSLRPETYQPNDSLSIEWAAFDPDETPAPSGLTGEAWISVTFDGGDTYPAKYRDMPATLNSHGVGAYVWKVPTLNEIWPGHPESLKEINTVAIQVKIRDRAGNYGVALTRMFSVAEPGSALLAQAREHKGKTSTETVTPSSGTTTSPAPSARNVTRRTAHFQRGVIYLLREDFDEAAEEFQSAYACDNLYAPALANLAISLFYDDRADKALGILDQATKRKEFLGDVHLAVTYGWLLLERGQPADRTLAWRALMDVASNKARDDREQQMIWKAKALLAMLNERSGRMDDARRYWSELYAETPTDSPLRRKAHDRMKNLTN